MTMVDLNLWRLEYDDVSLEFGTHESGHPFTAQVAVTPAELETDDLPHPRSDGVLFGEDFTRGMSLAFTGAHLDTMPLPSDRKWVPVMDGAQPFEQAWRARRLRRRVGAVATLTNVDRGRFAYGRPRPYVPGLEVVRHGWLTYACGFSAVDDRFYDVTEKVVVAGVDPGESAAFTFPMTFPFSGTTPTETRAWVDNAGTDDAWPIVTFRAGGHPRLEFLNDMGGIEWTLEVDATLAADEEVVIDTRPWVRSVLRRGTSAPGILRGDRLADVSIPPGTHELRLVASDPTGLAEVEVRWHDAYGSL